jgi:DNA polymerase III alpha subunit
MTDNSQSDDKIRKVYVKDLKRGEAVTTVFKALKKERHASRSGKTFLAVTLVDKTGEIDARVFENVEAAEMLFAIGDFLLVEGKVGSFHNKSQVVIDKLERLDPGPIDAAEFAYEPPPVPEGAVAAPAAVERTERARDKGEPDSAHRQARARLLKLLDDPTIALGLDALLRHLEKDLEERVLARLGGQGPRVEKRPRPDPRPRHDGPAKEHKEPRPEPKRDPTLPSGLAFKPFNALVPDPGSSSTGGES